MNIIELCLSPGLGGLELYVFRSALALSPQHNVLSVTGDTGKLRDRFAEHPELVTQSLHYSRSYLPIINALRLARIIDMHKADVIHIHWGKDLALSALARRFSNYKPALVYTRQMKITRSKNDPYHRFLYAQMDSMLCITKLLAVEAKTFIHRQADRISTLYYGVAAPEQLLASETIQQQRAQHQLAGDDFVVGLFGRLEDGKGQHLLIKAIAEAGARHGHRIHALIVGHEMTPGYASILKNLAAELGVDKQIRFADFVDQPQQLMQICDCIALTSYEETFGLVLPEAMRVGVAVIGSKAGGVPEIIEHETSGLLFTSRDVSSLCEQLSRLYADPDFRHRIAAAGKARADKLFNQDEHFVKLEQHFMLLNSAKSSAL